MSRYIIERYIGASWRAHVPVEIKADSLEEALRAYCQKYLVGTRRLTYENVKIRVLLDGVVWLGYPKDTGHLFKHTDEEIKMMSRAAVAEAESILH